MSDQLTEETVLPSLDDVTQVAATVWACYVDERAPLTYGAPAPEPGQVAVVQISGAWQGSVALRLSELSADAVTLRMIEQLGLHGITTEEVMAELVNMIGGNIKSLLPVPSTLSIPVVGAAAAGTEQSGTGFEVDLDWVGHSVRVSVCAAA